ncbi:MAG: transcriptional regulator [Salinicola sp.]|uniref:LysR family transcriptional regulator n=1 Tax=uncultured Salinicola sp. TaxID=1193542 RepID=UPI000C961C2B|nr:LysR family transcriptional regulator [uncultured Salinicola sp.]MAM57030.1 transcriptional regulator [Salinicola sp.]
MKHDLASLNIFLCVAEEKSLTRASVRAHIAVSAVSKRIAELEGRVGTPLFVRFARGVELTTAGDALLVHVRRVFARIEEMDEELASFSEEIRGNVRICATTSALSQFLPFDIASFRHKYPKVNLDIEGRVGGAILRALRDGEADLGVFSVGSTPPDIEVFRYRTYELALAVPLGHSLASGSSIRYDTLAEYSMVAQHADSLLYEHLEKEAESRGFRLKVGVRVSSFDCMCQLVACQYGLAIMPRETIEVYAKSIPIVAVSLDEEWAERDLVVGVKTNRYLDPAVKSLVEHLTHY